MRTKIGWIGAVVLGALLVASDARAERDPERIARRCIDAIGGVTEDTIGRIGRITHRTVEVVLERIEAGDREGAQEAARAGARRASRAARSGASTIEDGARRCVRVLRGLEADRELIGAVVRAGERGRGAIERAFEACLARIRDALGDGGR